MVEVDDISEAAGALSVGSSPGEPTGEAPRAQTEAEREEEQRRLEADPAAEKLAGKLGIQSAKKGVAEGFPADRRIESRRNLLGADECALLGRLFLAYAPLQNLAAIHLSRSCSKCPARGVAALEAALSADALPILEEFGFSDNKVGDVDGERLLRLLGTKCGALMTKLHMCGNGLGRLTSSAFAECSPKLFPKLEQLHLDNNQIDDQGAIDMAFGGVSDALYVLYIANNCIGAQGADAIAQSVSQLYGKWNRMIRIKLDTFLLRMEDLRNKDYKLGFGAITKIELMGVTDRGVDKGEKLGDHDMACIAMLLTMPGVLPKLDLLRLDENKVGAAGWELFAGAIKPGASEAFMSVRHLQIQRNQLGDRSMKFFLPHFRAGALPNLEELHIAYNKLTDETLVPFGEALQAGALPKLTHLNLSQNKLADAGAAALAHALDAQHAQCDRAAFEALYLGGNIVGDAGGRALARVVAAGGPAGGNVPKLGTLMLFDNKLSGEGKDAIRAAVEGRPLLEREGSLDLE